MGCRILEGKMVNECGRQAACFYDSVSGAAFGPLMEDAEEAEAFLHYLQDHPTMYDGKKVSDPRVYSGHDLATCYADFLKRKEVCHAGAVQETRRETRH